MDAGRRCSASGKIPVHDCRSGRARDFGGGGARRNHGAGERDKAWRGPLSGREISAARDIVAELGFYQWLSAVEEKGSDGARYHFGVRAQRVFDILDRHGLDWHQYAWCCYDQWSDQFAMVDEERVLVQAAGDRFGVRTDQLALFLIAALEERVAALEALS